MRKLCAVLPVIFFVAAIASVIFAYGVAVGVYQIFPYKLIDRAHTALLALIEAEKQKSFFVEPIRDELRARLRGDTLVTIHDPAKSFDGLTFFTAFTGDGFTAELVDMEGNSVHQWSRPFSEVWPNPKHVEFTADDDVIDFHGAHLYPNGDVLFNYTGGNFPYGGGLAKLDRNSDIIWTLDRNTHHDIDVVSSGKIYALAHNYLRTSPLGLSTTIESYYDDVVLIINADGTVEEEISILQAIRDSDFRGLLSLNYRDTEDIAAPRERLEDPFHVNTVEVVEADTASAFNFLNIGDIIISIRNINTIAAIDGQRKIVKWALTGPFIRQHDPDLSPAGTIFVYDNRGHRGPGGASRILEINPATQAIEWSYTGDDAAPFFSASRGKLQLIENGNVLFVEPDGGRMVEVTRDKEIVWEFANRLEVARGIDVTDKVGLITQAERYATDDLEFLN